MARLTDIIGYVVRTATSIFNLGVTVLACGFSLLPLSVLLMVFPALVPQESVLSDTVGRQSFIKQTLQRIFAVLAGLIVLIALLAFSVETVTRLPLAETGHFAVVARTLFPSVGSMMGRTEREQKEAISKFPPEQQKWLTTPLWERLPPAMVQHWPFVIVGMYTFDILLLMLIGKVPLAYNVRNVRVRWKTNVMTAVAFTAVIALLTFLLAFVNGMNNLTENSGVPGNVFVLSDGSTDEIFSNLGYGDLDNVERVKVDLDMKDKPLAVPISIKQTERNGKTRFLASRETFYSINQAVQNSDPPRRRFVQLRTIEDPYIAGEVHNIELYPGGKWFNESGVDDKSRIQCVIGEGMATTLGPDFGKKRLEVGDVFSLGEMDWIVTGIMKSEGTTFGSEIWARRFSRIYKPFGKDKYTTLVMRTDADTKAAAQAFAYHLNQRYTQQKLKAFSEPDYYAELTKTNNTFLAAIIVVCVVMAIGGVFGMMTTMFASIAQRIRDIGVLRLLGFKRWQVMVSFLLESLMIALIGGAVGCLVAYLLADGKASTSTLSGGGGGPGGKSVALRLNVDSQVVAVGMLFTFVMGRIGGLVPALSAMRMKILDSLR